MAARAKGMATKTTHRKADAELAAVIPISAAAGASKPARVGLRKPSTEVSRAI